MEISRIKLPCVPNEGGVLTFCTVKSGTSHVSVTEVRRIKHKLVILYGCEYYYMQYSKYILKCVRLHAN